MKLGDLLPGAQLGSLDGLLEQEAWDRHGITPTHRGTNFSAKELLLSLKGQASFRTSSVRVGTLFLKFCKDIPIA